MEDTQIYGHSRSDNGEEDYIELEVIGSSNSIFSLFHFKNSSPPQQEARSSEFEFQMLPNNFIHRNMNTSSTADELFYNGKLLPLDHLPLHNNHPITNNFIHVGKNIVDFEQSLSTPFIHSCHVTRKHNQEDYFEYSKDDESSKYLHVNKSFGGFDQSISTPFCLSCHHVSRKLKQEEYYSKNDESSKGSKFLHVSKSFDDFDQSLSMWKQLLAEIQGTTAYNRPLLSGPSLDPAHNGSFNVLDYPFFSTRFCQSCHDSRKLINQEEYYYSTDDEKSTSKILHVSKSFDDLKLSLNTPFFQSCHLSGELNNQGEHFFGYSTDGESSRKSKWPKGSLTRKLKLVKQLSFDHSKLKCLINNSVNKFVANHRMKSSFSGAIKRLLATKSCSSSKNSNGNIQEMHLLVRRDHVYAEVDPIQAAIAHCKNSHQVEKKFNSRKSNVSDSIGLRRSLSASKIMFEEQERIGLCRG